jgi:hypothetical protein
MRFSKLDCFSLTKILQAQALEHYKEDLADIKRVIVHAKILSSDVCHPQSFACMNDASDQYA